MLRRRSRMEATKLRPRQWVPSGRLCLQQPNWLLRT